MRSVPGWFVLLSLACASGAYGNALPFNLYNNTTNDTGDFVAYSFGPYIALGDEIQLVSAGTANEAEVEMYNNGGPGTFDAELDLFDAGSPVGANIGTFDYPTDISSVGGDVLDLTFDLEGVTVPQNLVFTVSVSNVSAGMDLAVDMSEPPILGTSDNTFMIVETSGSIYSELGTNSENVFFGLSGTPVTAVPETSSLTLLGTGLLVAGLGVRAKRQR